jgi:Na+/melibiose symporter-like transporter
VASPPDLEPAPEPGEPEAPRRHPDFTRLWAGQTVSVFGTRLSDLAIPLTAITVLHATSLQMGVLRALPLLPNLLIGMPAGAIADRRRRRPLLIACDVTRAAVLLTVPLAAAQHLLGIGLLMSVAFLVGCAAVIFDITYRAYLPTLVPTARLVEGNSRMELSTSVSRLAGPGAGGLIVQVLSGPVAIAADACTYLVSALFVATIRAPEARVPAARGPWRDEVLSGMRHVFASRMLRTVLVTNAGYNFLLQFAGAVTLLYLVTERGLSPALVGLAYSVGALGAVLGAVMARRATQAWSVSTVAVGGAGLIALSLAIVPAAFGPPLMVTGFVTVAMLLSGLGLQLYNISVTSSVQAMTPDRLRARTMAAFRVIGWGATPAGAVLGGLLGGLIGFRPTLAIGAVATACVLAWLAGWGRRGRSSSEQEAIDELSARS